MIAEQKLNLHEWLLVTLTNPLESVESVIFYIDSCWADRSIDNKVSTFFCYFVVSCFRVVASRWHVERMSNGCPVCSVSVAFIRSKTEVLRVLFHLWYYQTSKSSGPRLEISLENLELLNTIDLNLFRNTPSLSSLNRALFERKFWQQ